MSLEDYKISPVTGFVPLNPLVRLPDVYFDPWEKIMDRFSDLISTDSLYKEIQELPLLDATRLKTWQEYQRAFLVLCFLTHGYVWKDVGRISETLAPQLAIPLVKVSDYLGMNPVLCHASVALWNYQLVDPKGPIDLSNMEALATFTGTSDESWFHNVTAFVEISGAPCLPEILSAIQLDNEPDQLEIHLNKIRDALIQMNLALPRLFEKLDPKVFYCQIRPFLSGWTSDPLPRGLKYGDEYRSYSGASAAQSCLIATLDVALGVEHYGHSSKPNEFMQAMRQYMPKPHREFLEMVQAKSLIRPCVMQLENTYKTVLAYNACVHQLKLFRDKHVQIVSLYIINQARKESQADTKELKGTAGASVIPFLKKSRDETNETKIPQPETVTPQIEKTPVSAKYVAHAHTLCAYSAFFIALVVGCYTQYEKIVTNEYFGYPQEWIPSVSATTGDRYPARAIFQTMIAMTSGPRLLLVFLWYLMSHSRFLFVIGFIRTVSCGGWVYVTSTDDHNTHDVAMVIYVLCTLPWMLSVLAQSQHPVALKTRRIITLLFFSTLIPMIYFFIQHKVHRVPGAYTIYAFLEWSLIIYDVGFDALSCYEFEKIDLKVSPRIFKDIV